MGASARLFATMVCSTILFMCQATAIAFPLSSEIPAYGENVVAYGYATPDGKSEVEYSEIFQDDPLGNTVRVNYYASDGKVIAYKNLEFGADRNVPEFFEFIDYRRGRGFRLTVNDKTANLLSLKISADGTETVRSNNDIEIDKNTVIDAAFHRFILSDWDSLLAGERRKVKFLRIDKATLIPLKIKRNKCEAPDMICFKISIDNMVLQAMLPNIDMQYDNNKNLIRYNGIGPITTLKGKPKPVDIIYGYAQ